MTPQEFARLARLPPREAVEYLKRRKLLTVSYNWTEVWEDEHARQFTISRLTRLDLLSKIQAAITDSVAGDLSRRDWMRDVEKMLFDAGWWGKKTVIDPATSEAVTTTFNPSRLKLILDTNSRSAYSTGVWERGQRNKRTHPYFRVVTMDDEKVRLTHRPYHNLTLPVDHVFWRTHWFPFGYKCRCRNLSISQRDYDRGVAPNGAPLKKTAPPIVLRDWVNPHTGEVKKIPVGIDPGFGYNPGMASQRLDDLIAEKLAAAPPALAEAARRAGLTKE